MCVHRSEVPPNSIIWDISGGNVAATLPKSLTVRVMCVTIPKSLIVLGKVTHHGTATL